jgi:glycine/D-amino acid oxidase-like deaminating enzyme
MSYSPCIVVVGAGIIGASIAWHLAARGAQVTVVDAEAAGGVATENSFAWINASWGNPEPYFRLRVRAMAEWRRLAAEVPAIPISWTGSLCWDLPHDRLEAYARQHGAWGYGIRPVDRAEAAGLEPHLAEPPAFALHVAEEAAVEPGDAARALLQDAQRRGARVLPNTRATGLAQTGGTITGIETDGGDLAADEVVVAAGVGTPALLASAGLRFAMHAPPGLLAHSRPHGKLLNGLVIAPDLHMRQTRSGRIVAGFDFGGADPGADPQQTAEKLFARTRRMLTRAENLELERYTVGYRPTPEGGFPAIGRVRPGLYLAVMHSGITLAPAVGRFAAEELLGAARDPLVAPYGAAVTAL